MTSLAFQTHTALLALRQVLSTDGATWAKRIVRQLQEDPQDPVWHTRLSEGSLLTQFLVACRETSYLSDQGPWKEVVHALVQARVPMDPPSLPNRLSTLGLLVALKDPALVAGALPQVHEPVEQWQTWTATVRAYAQAPAPLPLLHEAASENGAALVKLLLSAGAAVDQRTELGETPLMCASSKTVAQLLLAHGADGWATRQDGKRVEEVWLGRRDHPRFPLSSTVINAMVKTLPEASLAVQQAQFRDESWAWSTGRLAKAFSDHGIDARTVDSADGQTWLGRHVRRSLSHAYQAYHDSQGARLHRMWAWAEEHTPVDPEQRWDTPTPEGYAWGWDAALLILQDLCPREVQASVYAWVADQPSATRRAGLMAAATRWVHSGAPMHHAGDVRKIMPDRDMDWSLVADYALVGVQVAQRTETALWSDMAIATFRQLKQEGWRESLSEKDRGHRLLAHVLLRGLWAGALSPDATTTCDRRCLKEWDQGIRWSTEDPVVAPLVAQAMAWGQATSKPDPLWAEWSSRWMQEALQDAPVPQARAHRSRL